MECIESSRRLFAVVKIDCRGWRNAARKKDKRTQQQQLHINKYLSHVCATVRWCRRWSYHCSGLCKQSHRLTSMHALSRPCSMEFTYHMFIITYYYFIKAEFALIINPPIGYLLWRIHENWWTWSLDSSRSSAMKNKAMTIPSFDHMKQKLWIVHRFASDARQINRNVFLCGASAGTEIIRRYLRKWSVWWMVAKSRRLKWIGETCFHRWSASIDLMNVESTSESVM